MERNRFMEDAKKIYESQKIPQQLSNRVENALKFSPGKQRSVFHGLRAGLCTAAVCFLVFTVLLNTNQVFAESVYNIPVLGNVARVVTFREYKEQNKVNDIVAEIPKIENTGNPELEQRINEEIQTRIDTIIERTKQENQESYESYEEYFGSEPERNYHALDISYEVKHSDEKILSFVIYQLDIMAGSNTQQYCYNIDMQTGKDLTLKDLFGENYKDIIDQNIYQQIAEREASDPNIQYFHKEDSGIEGFTGISEDQKFYINENGNIVITFDKYEIAPGYMGIQEFEIPIP